VDVIDTARLHVVALLDVNVESERLFACAAPYTWSEALPLIQEIRPDANVPSVPDGEGRDLFNFSKVSERAENLLRSWFRVTGWTDLKSILAHGMVD
jgi:hypothetical protein